MIYFLRHGLDDETYVGGWSDVDLIDIGINQVKCIGEYIKLNQIPITNIISSDIKRAITTTKIINTYLNKPIIYSPLLRELDKGTLTGTLKNDNTFKPITIKDKYPDGESMLQFYQRIKNHQSYFLNNDNTLFITHRGVINMLYFIVKQQPIDLNKSQFSVDHASLHEYDPVKETLKRIY